MKQIALYCVCIEFNYKVMTKEWDTPLTNYPLLSLIRLISNSGQTCNVSLAQVPDISLIRCHRLTAAEAHSISNLGQEMRE